MLGTNDSVCCCHNLNHDVYAVYCYSCGKALCTTCKECGYKTARHDVIYCALCGTKYEKVVTEKPLVEVKSSHQVANGLLKAFLFDQIDRGEFLTHNHVLVTALNCLFPAKNVEFAGTHFSFVRGAFVNGNDAKECLESLWQQHLALDLTSILKHSEDSVRWLKKHHAPQVFFFCPTKQTSLFFSVQVVVKHAVDIVINLKTLQISLANFARRL